MIGILKAEEQQKKGECHYNIIILSCADKFKYAKCMQLLM